MAELDYRRILQIIQVDGVPREKPAKGTTHAVQNGNYKVTFTAAPEKGLIYGDDLRTLQWMLLHAIEHDGVHGRLCCFRSFDIHPSLKEGDSYKSGLRRSFGWFLLLTAYFAVHFTG